MVRQFEENLCGFFHIGSKDEANQIKKWIEENVGEEDEHWTLFGEWPNLDCTAFVFTLETDAVLFKLRWL